MACHNSNCQISKATAFSICENCENVSEISNSRLSKYLSNFVDEIWNEVQQIQFGIFWFMQKCKSKNEYCFFKIG